jgi:hypothetical protein
MMPPEAAERGDHDHGRAEQRDVDRRSRAAELGERAARALEAVLAAVAPEPERDELGREQHHRRDDQPVRDVERLEQQPAGEQPPQRERPQQRHALHGDPPHAALSRQRARRNFRS